MKITTLIVDDLSKIIKNKLELTPEEIQEKKINKLINGDEDDEDEMIILNTLDHSIETDLYFDINKVSGFHLSSSKWKDKLTIILILDGMEYLCLYEEKVINQLKEYLK